jgi:hypothetical protein
VDSRLRGTATLLTSRRMAGSALATIRITAEVEGQTKPACIADQVLAFYN